MARLLALVSYKSTGSPPSEKESLPRPIHAGVPLQLATRQGVAIRLPEPAALAKQSHPIGRVPVCDYSGLHPSNRHSIHFATVNAIRANLKSVSRGSRVGVGLGTRSNAMRYLTTVFADFSRFATHHTGHRSSIVGAIVSSSIIHKFVKRIEAPPAVAHGLLIVNAYKMRVYVMSTVLVVEGKNFLVCLRAVKTLRFGPASIRHPLGQYPRSFHDAPCGTPPWSHEQMAVGLQNSVQGLLNVP